MDIRKKSQPQNFKIIGRLEGKHRIHWEEGVYENGKMVRQTLADDADLIELKQNHKWMQDSQEPFPSERPKLSVQAGGNATYDLAFAGYSAKLDALQQRIELLESLLLQKGQKQA